GPVVRGRERWLRQRGLLSGAAHDEELVVVRAELPV
ncbi:methyltransferase, partial [Streptomyces sp. SID6013]|nr:methyltransferase [Streptomyces sp. SID6013]